MKIQYLLCMMFMQAAVYAEVAVMDSHSFDHRAEERSFGRQQDDLERANAVEERFKNPTAFDNPREDYVEQMQRQQDISARIFVRSDQDTTNTYAANRSEQPWKPQGSY
jgi:hypothetical protein